MYLCVWIEIFHAGCALTYSTSRGMISSDTLHSGCRKSLHSRPTCSAFRSAHCKSASCSTMTFTVRLPERLRQRRLLTLGRKANPVEIPAERVRPRSFEKYLESVPLERRSQRPQRVKQRLSARDDDSLRLARSRSPHHLRNIGRRIEFRIPRIFGIAPAAAYVASAQADEIGRFARMESFALNRIEILHQRQFPPSVQQVVIRRFLHRTIRSPRKHPCNSGPTGRSPARIPR